LRKTTVFIMKKNQLFKLEKKLYGKIRRIGMIVLAIIPSCIHTNIKVFPAILRKVSLEESLLY